MCHQIICTDLRDSFLHTVNNFLFIGIFFLPILLEGAEEMERILIDFIRLPIFRSLQRPYLYIFKNLKGFSERPVKQIIDCFWGF